MRRRGLRLAPFLSLAPCLAGWLALSGGCGGDGGGAGADRLPSFRDLTSAPAPIRTAAKAVVRIRTATALGTGSFISSSGMLLTNNHVLGADVCPLEGCWFQISILYQSGQPVQDPLSVFGVPVAVDAGLDVAVLQLYQFGAPPGGVALQTPDFLTWNDQDAGSLLGTHVTIVGHPHGRLKKWSDGVVIDAFGRWFSSTAYILPGDSGSPILDDQGRIVGLVHRAPTGEDLITSNGVNVSAIGSASAPVHAATQAPLPDFMISTAAETTADDAVTNNVVYLNGRAASVTIGGAPVSVLGLLGTACDKGLARTDFSSPDDLSLALVPCLDAINWIECRADVSPPSYGVVCPSGDDAVAWAARYQTVNQLWVAMNGNSDLLPVTFGIAALAPFKAEGQIQGAQSLQAALSAAQQLPDFGIANYLAAFDVAANGGVQSLDWLRQYRTHAHYQFSAFSIVSAFLWWQSYQIVKQPEVLSVLDTLANDPGVDVDAKLYIDEAKYFQGQNQ